MKHARIELVRTNGIFSLDGEDFEVENNIGLVGDDHEVLVVDAAHDATPIVDAIGDRRLRFAGITGMGRNRRFDSSCISAMASL